MKKSKILSILLSTILVTLCIGCSSNIDGVKSLDNDKWIQDINHLDNSIKSIHPDLFRNISQEQWNQNIDNLKEDVPKLSDIDISLHIAQIISSIQDGHTYVDINSIMKPIGEESFSYENVISFPFLYKWFGDEVRVSSCSEEYKEVLGYKLVSINNISTDEILKKVSTIVGYDNEQSAKAQAIRFISIYEVLNFLDIVNNEDAVFTFEDDNKEKVTFTITSSLNKDITLINLSHKMLKTDDKPKNESDCYWFKHINEDNVLYFQYNECISNDTSFINKEQRKKYPSFYDFQDKLIESINNTNFDKLIIDLRKNTGGSLGLTDSLIMKLKSNTDIGKYKIYVLTSKYTFSAGAISAWNLKNNLDVTIIGEETGGNVNLFTRHPESDILKLPNSNLIINHSSSFIDYMPGYVGGVKPDIEIKQTYKNYINGIDDCYEYIINN